jgi:hypothetical protein
MAGLAITVLALITSVVFNILQYEWRKEDKAEQKRRDVQREAEQRRREEMPPEIYNGDGTSAPIKVGGRRGSSDGSVDVWAVVTVVNSTQVPMKISPVRLVASGKGCQWLSISFHQKFNALNRSERISLMGNSKEDYELHFHFAENKWPKGDAELWLTSTNRPEEFFVPVKFFG